MAKIYTNAEYAMLRKLSDALHSLDPDQVLIREFSDIDYRYVVGPDEYDRVILSYYSEDNKDKFSYTCPISKGCIYLAPLFWVEDKPVYAGDVLYGKLQSNKGRARTVTGLNAHGVVNTVECGERTCLPESLTWTKPTEYPDSIFGWWIQQEEVWSDEQKRQIKEIIPDAKFIRVTKENKNG